MGVYEHAQQLIHALSELGRHLAVRVCDERAFAQLEGSTPNDPNLPGP